MPVRSNISNLVLVIAAHVLTVCAAALAYSLRPLASPFLPSPILALHHVSQLHTSTTNSIVQTGRSIDPDIESPSNRMHSSQAKHKDILAAQRLNRPVSPHLSIYRPQITWLASISSRLTGIFLSSSFYLFGLTYLASPFLGWGLEDVVAVVAGLPVALTAAIKSVVAVSFVFHCCMGVRHLIWDQAKMLTNRQVLVSGWLVVGLSLASGVYLGLAY